MVKILVFDTETTGLPPETSLSWKKKQKWNKKLLNKHFFPEMWSQVIHKWPSIIQLSYIFYDTLDPTNAKIFNQYIDIPDHIDISATSINIHHITKDIIEKLPPTNKKNIHDALKDFLQDFEKADVIVGHSVAFDRQMIISELLRLKDSTENTDAILKMMDNKKFHCTMERTKKRCNLLIDKKGIQQLKLPKLIESYEHFFGYKPDPKLLHNAIIDVVVCLRVYCMTFEPKLDVYKTNREITKYIDLISPYHYKKSYKTKKNKWS